MGDGSGLATLVLEEPRGVGGKVEAPPSLFYTLYSIAASALAGVVVEGGDWEATLARIFLANLRRIGYCVDYSPRGGLRAERGCLEEAGTTISAPLRAECSPLLLYLSSIVAGLALEPGAQVVIKASCSELAEYAKPLASLLYQLGVRAWPSSFPRILVVEGSRLYTSSIIRVPARSGLLAATTLLASLAERTPFRVLLPPGLARHSRVRQAASILSSLGLRVEIVETAVTVEGRQVEAARIEVPRGYAEAGLLAALSARGRVEVEGLPQTLGGEEELLAWLKLLGVNAEREESGVVVFEGGEPRSGIVDVSPTPQLFSPLLAAAAAMKTSILVSGLADVREEHPYAKRLEKLAGIVGAAGGRIEEKGSGLLVEFRNPARRVVDCSKTPQEACSSLLAGLSASPGGSRVVVKNIDPGYLSSRLLPSLYALGAVIREEGS